MKKKKIGPAPAGAGMLRACGARATPVRVVSGVLPTPSGPPVDTARDPLALERGCYIFYGAGWGRGYTHPVLSSGQSAPVRRPSVADSVRTRPRAASKVNL